MGSKILLLLCFAAALRPSYCEPKTSGDDERARLPEFLTELDLASLEASEEDIEALKTVVKRLAPEKNGVMGQPGVDFPALTSIPATTFSCRGLKGGYYADLETNCQVFHICDNGRKISFLCPNGTIFQQSQLICDWWFKVDCSKSQELYEQSAEQLAEEERKRTDAKRMNSEFHRSSVENDYQTKNSNYDGRQNGRRNPFGQEASKNQIPGSVGQRGQNVEYKSTTRGFDPNQIYSSNGATTNQFNQINDLAGGNTLRTSLDLSNNSQNNYKTRQQQQNQSSGRPSLDRGNYRNVDRQQNQLIDGANDEAKRQFNHEQRGASKFPGSNQNNYHNQQQQPARSNQQSLIYSSSNRNGGRDNERRNFAKSSSISSFDYEQTSNRVTPSYTETTTFRTSTSSPIKEYQQLAESAAFATNRGNRFNEAYSSSQFNSYYNNFNGNANGNGNNNNDNNNNKSKSQLQQKTTEKPRQKSITPTPRSDKITGNFLRVRGGSPLSVPFPTFQPIYKPRTSDSYSSNEYETTTLGSTIADTATTTVPSYTDYNIQNNQDKNVYTDNFDYGGTTSSSTNEETRVTTETSNNEFFTEDYLRNSVTPINDQATTNIDFFENTTPTIITSGTYVNAKSYTRNKIDGNNYEAASVSSGSTTSGPSSNSQELRQNSVVTAGTTNESSVRRFDGNSHHATTPTNYRDATNDQNTVNARNQENLNQQGRGLSKNSSRVGSQNLYKQSQNLLSTSTEKSLKSSTTMAQTQTGFTGKTLSPYDTSFTYQQGKVMSTLGPYVPFTKNYAYSTTATPSTTIKPLVYTATMPIYSSTASIYRSSSAKSLGKNRLSSVSSSVRPTARLRGGSAAYLPEKKSEVSTYFAKKHNLNERPLNEREHAMSMIQSLRGLDGTVSSIFGVSNATRSGLNIPTSSGPSTLHSLALYFATASDDFDTTAESRTDPAAESEFTESRDKTEEISKENTSVELPTNILTQHTINSYAELFNLNNALEGNSSVEENFNDNQDISNEDTDDLDIQQSEGPIDGARKSNSTRLRELAQVFTHALSAYLQDPDTFKKILTEIRPTEPTLNAENEEKFTASTLASTTLEDYPSVTKEKDEVLDFSDDTTPRVRRPTTIYPVTTTDLPITTDTFNQQEFYTTSSDHYTSAVTNGENSDGQTGPDNNFAFQVNHAFGTSSNGGNEVNNVGTNGGVYYPEEASGPSETTALDETSSNDQIGDYGDNYFPTGESGNNKIGGFQNNTQSGSTYEPYGKDVKPFDATPINDNYVSSSTPATYIQAYKSQANKFNEASDKRYNGVSFGVDESVNSRRSEVTRKSESLVNSEKERKRDSESFKKNSEKLTTEPFRIRYYDPTTSKPWNNRESLLTAGSVYSKYHENRNDFTNGITDRPNFLTSVVTSKTVEPLTRQTYTESFDKVTNNQGDRTTIISDNFNRQNEQKLNNHWTSSPTVTQLWESTVFVDPKRINQGLVSGTARDTSLESSTLDYAELTQIPYSQDNKNNKNNQESLVTDATSSGLSSRNKNNLDYPSSPWKWSGSATTGNTENDSPTAFTLLPQTGYASMDQNIATASPIYTTRSSITTTITSSVTSTSSNSGVSTHQDGLFVPRIKEKSSNRPKNEIGNEMEKAHEMFGKLNTTSTNTLMRVMKQADTNATVRQLVLLLINHCNGPMNKTMEEEKEQLLDALLRMPVNEFTSEESRGLVAGINRINLPIGKDNFAISSTTTSTSTTSTEEPAVTTFRSKKGRRFKSNADEATLTGKGTKNDDIVTAESGNALSTEDTSASDARALELLRSLYTIAAKWG